MDRLALAIIVITIFGAAVYIEGIERTAAAVFLVLAGLWIYQSLARRIN